MWKQWRLVLPILLLGLACDGPVLITLSMEKPDVQWLDIGGADDAGMPPRSDIPPDAGNQPQTCVALPHTADSDGTVANTWSPPVGTKPLVSEGRPGGSGVGEYISSQTVVADSRPNPCGSPPVRAAVFSLTLYPDQVFDVNPSGGSWTSLDLVADSGECLAFAVRIAPNRKDVALKHENKSHGIQHVFLVVGTRDQLSYVSFKPHLSNVPMADVLVSERSVTTNESGTTAEVMLSLTTVPFAPVSVTFENPDSSQIQIEPCSVLFSPDDWQQPRRITVHSVDDDVADGLVVVPVAMTIRSLDDRYSKIGGSFLTVNNRDNEPSVSVQDASAQFLTEGQGSRFLVALNAPPHEPVDILINVGDPIRARASPVALHFDATNWSIPRTVVVDAIDDNVFTTADVTVAIGQVQLHLPWRDDDHQASFERVVGVNFPGDVFARTIVLETGKVVALVVPISESQRETHSITSADGHTWSDETFSFPNMSRVEAFVSGRGRELFLLTNEVLNEGGRLWRSIDDAKTWQLLRSFDGATNVTVTDQRVYVTSANKLWVGQRRGLGKWQFRDLEVFHETLAVGSTLLLWPSNDSKSVLSWNDDEETEHPFPVRIPLESSFDGSAGRDTVVFFPASGPGPAFRLSRTPDGTWSSPFAIGGLTPEARHRSISVGPDGSTFMIEPLDHSTEIASLDVRRTNPTFNKRRAVGFSAQGEVLTLSSGAALLVGVNGGYRSQVVLDGGSDGVLFPPASLPTLLDTRTIRLNPTDERCALRNDQTNTVASSPSGNVHVVMFCQQPGSGQTQPVVVSSPDSGRTWPWNEAFESPNVTVGDWARFDRAEIAVADNGKAVIALRIPLGTDFGSAAFWSRSHDKGAKWSNVLQAGALGEGAEYPHVAVTSTGFALMGLAKDPVTSVVDQIFYGTHDGDTTLHSTVLTGNYGSQLLAWNDGVVAATMDAELREAGATHDYFDGAVKLWMTTSVADPFSKRDTLYNPLGLASPRARMAVAGSSLFVADGLPRVQVFSLLEPIARQRTVTGSQVEASIAADASGRIFATGRSPQNEVIVQVAPSESTQFNPGYHIAPIGSHPSVATLPGGRILIVYQVGPDVMATIGTPPN
jgi:hypothetical protein